MEDIICLQEDNKLLEFNYQCIYCKVYLNNRQSITRHLKLNIHKIRKKSYK